MCFDDRKEFYVTPSTNSYDNSFGLMPKSQRIYRNLLAQFKGQLNEAK